MHTHTHPYIIINTTMFPKINISLRKCDSIVCGWKIMRSMRIATAGICRTFGKLRGPMRGLTLQHLGAQFLTPTTAAPLGMARVMETVMFAQESQKRRRRKRRKPMINLHELHFSSKWSFFHIYIYMGNDCWFVSVCSTSSLTICMTNHMISKSKAIVKVNANLLKISQWEFKLTTAGVSWAKLYFRDWLNNEICMQHDSPNFL